MRIIRVRVVMQKTGLGRCTIYRYVSASLFPKQVPLGGRAVGWVESEIDEWIEGRIRERDNNITNQQ